MGPGGIAAIALGVVALIASAAIVTLVVLRTRRPPANHGLTSLSNPAYSTGNDTVDMDKDNYVVAFEDSQYTY